MDRCVNPLIWKLKSVVLQRPLSVSVHSIINEAIPSLLFSYSYSAAYMAKGSSQRRIHYFVYYHFYGYSLFWCAWCSMEPESIGSLVTEMVINSSVRWGPIFLSLIPAQKNGLLK